MDNIKDKRYKKLQRNFNILFAMTIIISCVLGAIAIVNEYKYQEAIHLGAKNTVTAIELVAACQSLGNFTETQLKEQYFRMFILNRTG